MYYRVGGLKGNILFELNSGYYTGNGRKFFEEVIQNIKTIEPGKEFFVEGATNGAVSEDRTLVNLQTSEEPYTEISVNTGLMLSIIEHMLKMEPESGLYIYENGRVADMESIAEYKF